MPWRSTRCSGVASLSLFIGPDCAPGQRPGLVARADSNLGSATDAGGDSERAGIIGLSSLQVLVGGNGREACSGFYASKTAATGGSRTGKFPRCGEARSQLRKGERGPSPESRAADAAFSCRFREPGTVVPPTGVATATDVQPHRYAKCLARRKSA